MKYIFKEIDDKNILNSFSDNFPYREDGFPATSFIQSFNWTEFQKSVNRECLSFGIFDKNNELVGVGIGVIINAKRGKYLYFRHGPLIDWSNNALVNETISYLKDVAKNKGLWFVRISPMITNAVSEKSILTEFPLCPMNDVEGLDTWVMDIKNNEDEIFSNIKKKVRYEIRKAESQGITIEIIDKDESIEDFYQILEDTVERKKWTSYSQEYIQKEFTAFAKDKKASLILAKYEGKNIAGGIFIHHSGQTFYHYGASLSKYQKLPAMYLVIWKAILEGKKHNSKYFNFWGISPDDKKDHPWYGLSQFKKKFPGEHISWAPCRDIYISRKYFLTNIYERYDKWRKGY